MSDTAGRDQAPGGEESDRPGLHGLWLAILGIVIGVIALVVKTSFSLYVDTWLGVVWLVVAAMGVAYAIDLFVLVHRGQRRVVSLSFAVLVTVVASALFAYEAQPPSRGEGKIDCKFGSFGFGYGRNDVWVKADVAKDEHYKFHVIWGAVEAFKEADLSREVYFLYRKKDFWSNGYATNAIDPGVTLSCGNGAPPTEAQIIQITDDDWQLRKK
ncbi:DUF308 domain-containing protein [Saccharothrix sp. HUAS TT1]|uniref:DUF308 domain-containing protein n=1 Tax=unclassified Saccharothrix TaxID=2593673 RepID=UPI00345B8220